uniref:Uncharacterized protein n=1 Tax=Populus trichocarpa TaxID=3694 RepID=A0A2K1Y2K8_POPTR
MSLELRAYCFFVFSSLVEVYGCGFLLLHFACAGKPSQTLVHGRILLNVFAVVANNLFQVCLWSPVFLLPCWLLVFFLWKYKLCLPFSAFHRLLLLFAFSTLHQFSILALLLQSQFV